VRLGAIFPQLESGADPVAIRDYAQAVEGMGYDHILIYDHVLGADTASRPNWRGAYTAQSLFHEPFVLYGYFAAVTERVELVTDIIILPQRQTALVAKQAAEIDVLSGGRLRLGIGVGWNEVEYEALGENFRNRGARSEEQIEVLRLLWTQEVVTFNGRWHTITEAGLNPLPVQRPIPIWIGGDADATMRRIARLGDGWFPRQAPDDQMRATLERLRDYTRQAGRAPEAVGIEARLNFAQTPEAEWASFADAWRALGATHLSVNTMGAGLASLRDHVEALRRVKEAVGD
jgi:probable F420-dependent oxidoreductase